MRWIRSWPQWWNDPTNCPEELLNRPYVIDNIERRAMSNFDYNTMDWPDENVYMLEWDIALDRKGRETFERYTLISPERVWTAGYYLNDGRFIRKGFGCIYLPRSVVKAFQATNPDRFTDSLFFDWYGQPPLTVPNVYPQHLNS